MEPFIVPREEHCISRSNINKSALKVLYRLRARGHLGFLAGGCVRDLLLGRTPKDFDIATDATPNQLKKMFSNCRLIGRRFRLAHIHFGPEIIEVATFRSNESSGKAGKNSKGGKRKTAPLKSDSGVLVRDNVFGTPEEDALRRDFTVNALFYAIEDFSIIDYADALTDLDAKIMRCIGDPDERYIEDPVRMLRAVRFAATLDFDFEPETWAAIVRQHAHLAEASNARLYEEVLKFTNSGAMHRILPLMRESGLLKVLFPLYSHWLEEQATEDEQRHNEAAWAAIDTYKKQHPKASAALRYGTIFSAYHQHKIGTMVEDGHRHPEAVTETLINHQQALVPSVLIPQRQLSDMIRIAASQPVFLNKDEAKAKKFKGMDCFADSFAYFRFQCDLNGEHHERIPFWEQLEAPKARKKSRRGRRH